MGKYNTRGANKRIQRNIVLMKESLQSVAGSDDEISTSKETNKKRKATKSVEYEKETKKIKRTNNTHDNYCWKCHNIESEIESSPEIRCSSCIRAFHPSCIKATKIDKSRSCYVCQQQSKDKETSNIDDEIHLSKLLLYIIDAVCPMDSEKYKPIVDWRDSEENERLICKKDFRLIHDRCIQRGIQYESYVELIDDIEWIHHNCIIIYGDKSTIATSAKKILGEVKNMLKDALDCSECYYKKIGNEPLTFLNICKTPHPLVWAKVKGYSYWPAKCLKVSNAKAHVRFFRTHQIASVPVSNVFAMTDVYSKTQDKKSNSKTLDKKSKNSLEFELATSELVAYIGIFIDQYGTSIWDPSKPINTPFDFEKEKTIIEDLLEKYKNHSRKTIVSGDALLSPPDNEPGSYPDCVDLVSEHGENEIQVEENEALPIQVTHETQNLFEQDVPMAIEDEAEDLLENATKIAETNNSDNDQSLINTINNDSMIKTGFQHSMSVIEDNPKEFQSIEQAISGTMEILPVPGSLLPTQTSDNHWLTQRMPSPAGISISNVISGTDVPSGTDLLAEVARCEAEDANFSMNMSSAESDPFQSTSAFSQNSIASANALFKEQLSLRNYVRATEAGDFCTFSSPNYQDEDVEIIDEVRPDARSKLKRGEIECLLQAIVNHDPSTHGLLKQANHMVQQFFLQFWGTKANLSKPEKIIISLEGEISHLKGQLEEMRRENSRLKNEKFDEKIRNADNIVRSLRAQIMLQEERHQREIDEKLKEVKEKHQKEIEEYQEKLENQKEKYNKLMADNEERFNERLKEAKTIKYCDKTQCFTPARYLCCYSGVNSYAYCSEKCKSEDDIHKRFMCKRTGSKQPSEEKEDSTPEPVLTRGVVQQSTTLIYSIQSHTNKEITGSSVSPQTSSANIHKINKIVSAKKTVEVARNINRNQNSSDIY